MVGNISYFDWELSFRNRPKHSAVSNAERMKLNSLGMPVDEFQSFLKEWEQKNLP